MVRHKNHIIYIKHPFDFSKRFRFPVEVFPSVHVCGMIEFHHENEKSTLSVQKLITRIAAATKITMNTVRCVSLCCVCEAGVDDCTKWHCCYSVFVRTTKVKVKKKKLQMQIFNFFLYIRLHLLLVQLGYRHHYIDYILHGKRKNISARCCLAMKNEVQHLKKKILRITKDSENTSLW